MTKRPPRISLVQESNFSWPYGSSLERFWLHVRRLRSQWQQQFANDKDSDQIPTGAEDGLEPTMRQDMFLWAPAFIGFILALTGFASYAMDGGSWVLPSLWWATLGSAVFLISGIALLDRYGVITIWEDQHSKTLQIRERIETYYNKGQEIFRRLGTDETITAEDLRRIVGDDWVQPVTEYLRGTLGNRKAAYFSNIARGSDPDEASVKRFGYQRALARARILDRLERLRQILADLHSFL